MLKGISPFFSPELLSTIYRMGHGDEIVLADAHFPGESYAKRLVRADGLMIADLLKAILPLYELDQYVPEPVLMMAAVEGDKLDPQVEKDYLKVIKEYNPRISVSRLERFEFYNRTHEAFAVVMTGDTRKYGNIILKKGVIPS